MRASSYIDDFAALGVDLPATPCLVRAARRLSRSFLRKTEGSCRSSRRSGAILDPDEIYELGEGALQAIAESDKPDTIKVFNLVKLLERLTERKARPHRI